MVVKIADNYEQMVQMASFVIASKLIEKDNAILGLATGSTPIGIYDRLTDMYEKKLIDFGNVITFNLDEYCGLDKNHEQSYMKFMKEHLFDKVNIKPDSINIPNGIVSDFEAECRNYENMIDSSGGIDIQLLGLGSNGHIGFNEPGTYFTNITHKVELTESTINDNARFFDNIDEVPKSALTMGIGTIMKSKSILLVANGKNKATACRDMIFGDISPNCQASALKMHKNVTVIIDRDAASLL